MSLQPFTLFSFNISACGFVLVGLKNKKKKKKNYKKSKKMTDTTKMLRQRTVEHHVS